MWYKSGLAPKRRSRVPLPQPVADAADLPSQRKHPFQAQSRRRALLAAGRILFAMILGRSSYVTRADEYSRAARAVQPSPSRRATIGIDCRYCHTSVETSSFAGIPPTKTCMNCHSQIWTNAPDARAGARQLPRRATDCAGSGCTTCRTSSTSTTASTSRRASAARPATAASTRCR